MFDDGMVRLGRVDSSFLLFQILEATGSNSGRELSYSDRRSSCFSSVFPVK